MNKYLKWLLYGSLFFSFYILAVPSSGLWFDILIRCIFGVLALASAIYLQKYKLALLAIVSLCLNMRWVYVYPKYVTPVTKRHAALERSAAEKEKYFGYLEGEAKKNVMSQQKDIAAKKALEFVDISLVKQDFIAGYEFLDEKTKLGNSVEQFKDNIIKLHSGIFPESIEATDYEPIPEWDGIKIYLCGKNDDKKFYYMITMAGFYKPTAGGMMEKDYKISDVELSPNPYSDNELRHSLKK
jgi:hypothetical protein